jgi:hypothetical protein
LLSKSIIPLSDNCYKAIFDKNHGICKQKDEKFEKILAIKILLQF